jgi:hypothetical protein
MTVEELITELGRYRLSSRVFLSLNQSARKVQLAVETQAGSNFNNLQTADGGDLGRGTASRVIKIDIPDE